MRRATADTARATAPWAACLALGVASLLSACAAPTQIDRAALNQERPAVKALVLPPPGGPTVVNVVERRYANAVEQTVVLGGNSRVPGQNMFRVQLFGPMGAEAGETRLADPRVANANVAREMRQLIPGVAMQRSASFVQNSFGPFGYATGRAASGDLCLYAWQRVASTPSLWASSAAIQLRLRLCDANGTEASLLAVMYGFTVTASFGNSGWNPFGSPPGADPRLGSTGRPIRPDGASGIVMTAPPAEPARVAVRAAAPVAPQPAPPAPPPPGAPTVPPPPAGVPASPADAGVVVPPPPVAEN